MKKWLKTGKKALSVIMAIMMLMSAWVWVAPTEAEAAAGTYTVVIKLMIADNYDMENSAATIKVSYYGNNGSDSTTSTSTSSQFSIAENALKEDNCTKTFTISNCPGYPAAILFGDAGFKSNNSIWNSHLNVEVTVNGTTVYNDKPNGGYTFNVGAGKGVGNLSLSGDSDWTNNKPYAKTITWSNTPEAMTCPKTGSTTQTVAASAKDQYGVQMYDPSWSVTSDRDTSGLAVSSAGVITVTNATNVDSGSYSTQTGKVTATWGSKSETKEFTITDSYYTATFNYKSADGSDTSATRSNYHGSTITAPSATDYDLGDNHYVFDGWSPNFSSVIIGDITYNAKYTPNFIEADYSAVNEAIAAADAIKANYGTEYELKYSLASRVALDTAINSVVTGLGRTQQTTVDGYATEINAKIAALEPNKFDVIFLDKNGAILKYEKNAEFETSVEAPAFPEEQKSYNDAENHYTYSGWDTDEYTSVIDDLVIAPVYTAEPHDWKIETVTSTCVQAGTQKYTCNVCGYVKYDGGDELGDHVWEADYTVDLEPTCVLEGSKSIHCSLCDARKDITAIEAKGHNWGDFAVAVTPSCDRIGISTRVCAEPDCKFCEHLVIDPVGHNYTKTTVPATCTIKGYDEYTCQNDGCGHSYRDNYTDVIAHTYGEWETVSEARCGVAGIKKQTCTECGYVNLGSIDALEHSLGDWKDVVSQSCTGKGYQVKTCVLCNNVIEERNLAALGHNYVEKTVVAPTCTSKGYTIEECNRANCGAQRVVNETEALGHGWTSTTVDADCTHSAYIEHVCANDSDHNYIEYVIGSNALLHDFNGTETIIDNATCTADGKKTVKCTRCDATTEVIIPRLGHSYGEWDKTTNPATNDKGGTWTRKCANCDDVETLTIPKGGHNLVEDTSKYVAPKCNSKGQCVYKCDAHENCTVTVTVELDYAQHTVAQKVTDATCTAPGSVEAYCSVCGTSFKTTETSVKAHNFEAQTPVAPTCTTSGYTPYKCANCDATYNMYTGAEATGHSYEASTTPVTCTATGSTTYTCACGDTYTETIPATGHNYVKGTVTAADCTTAGTEVYTCDNPNCGDTYTKFIEAAKGHSFTNWETVTAATADNYGVRKGTCACGDVEYELIAPIGNHTFEEKITRNATCTEKGEKAFTCTAHTNCTANYTEEIPATGHTQKISYTAPTCSTAGSSKVVCSVCSAEILSETIPATGIHDFSGAGVKSDATCTNEGSITYTCAICKTATKVETIPAKGHDLTTTVTDAKCGEKGSVVITCSRCDDPAVEKTYELGAKGHIWGEYIVEKNATCTEDGKKVAFCTNADCTEKNEIVIPKSGHSWSKWAKTDATTTADGKWERSCSTCRIVEALAIPRGHSLVKDTANSKAATCSAEGKEIYICEAHTDCGVKIELTLPKLQHTVAQREIEATCTKEGSVEAYCSVCKAVLSTEEIPVKAHAYAAGTPVAPTCTTSGYTPYKCSCGDTYNEYDESKPATGHTLVEGASTASCLNGGQMTLTCSKAGCTYNATVNVPALGHNYVAGATTAATCKTPATQTYNCSRCTDSYTVFTGAKTTEHTWGGWSVKESATPTSLGYQTAECTVCGQIKVETIPATGDHKFDDEVSRSDATCTTDGLVTYKCSAHTDCGLTSTVTIPATGHTEELQYQAATCEAAGYARRYCTTCKTVLETQEIPAIGHAWNDGTVTGANCVTDGKIEYSCTRTGCTETKTTVIPKDYISHDYVTTTTQPTCYKEGSIVVKCSREGCISNPVNEKLAKLEHSWDGGAYANEADKPTCEADGTMTYSCTAENCTASKTETVPATGHTWSTWTVTPSTNDAPGSVSRECTVCHKPESVEIPAGGHKLVVDTANSTDASCTAEGKLVYKCENHTDCGITVTVTVPKLQHELEKTEKFATCTDAGEVVTKCKNCNTATFTTIIPATGHNYSSEVTTSATCTSEGVRTYTCAHDAKHTYTEPVAKLPHNYVAGQNVSATCTTSGYTLYTCEKCGHTYKEIGAEAKGHTLVEGTSTATCTAGGKMTLTCDCGYSTTVAVPALGHDYGKLSSTDATCAAAATETYKCSRCDANYTISVGEKTDAHKYPDVWTEVVAPKEASIGYSTRACETCGKLEIKTLDATGEHKFADGQLVEDGAKKAATCTENGYETRKCSVHSDCGKTALVTIPATGHKEIAIEAVAATCEKEGSTAGTKCETCDTTLLAPVTLPKLGHAWGNEKVTPATCKAEGKIAYTCTRGGCNATHSVVIEIDENAHKYDTTVKSATCTDDGEVTTKCSLCGDTKTTSIPAKGHVWSETASSTTAASCEGTGSATYKCKNCTAENTVIVPALGHVYQAGEKVAATCTTSGYTVYTCKNDANHTYKVYDENAKAKGHTWGEWTVVTDATETTEGLKERKCTVVGCDGQEQEVIPAMMHEMTVLENVPATCKSAGHITYKCNVKHDEVECDYTLTVDLPKIAHTLSTTVIEASCTKAGSVVTECTVDGCDYKLEEALAVKPHTISVSYAYPSCTVDGYVKEECDVCDYEQTISTTAALGHDYCGTETVEKDASCLESGSKTVKCSRCDATTTVEIPAKGHSYKASEAEEATCTTSGYIPYTCTCGAGYKELTSEPNGHKWKTTPESERAATCSAPGEKVYKCENCDATNKVVTAQLTHSFVWTLEEAPTTTSEGLLVGRCAYDNCTEKVEVKIPAINSGDITCKVTFLVNGEVVAVHTVAYGGGTTAPEITNKAPDASGHYSYTWDKNFDKVFGNIEVNAVFNPETHKFGNWETVTPAACNKTGTQRRVCTVCGYEELGSIETSDHNYVVKEHKDATCTENGYDDLVCKDCGKTSKQVIRSLGHVMSYHEYVDATCTEEGSLAYYSCSRCGNNYADRAGKQQLSSVVISAKLHTIVLVKGKDATCTENGATDYYYCTACGLTQESKVILAYGHEDTNGDNVCDRCDGTYYEGGEQVCTCTCHKPGVLNELIFKIINFFWKLFGKNKSCDCGKLHY